jgi:hypothetical protein
MKTSLLSLAALLAGCHSASHQGAGPVPAPVSSAQVAKVAPAAQPHKVRAIEDALGKPQAPVVIESVLEGNTAHVTVRFPQGGAGVEVHASGAEGLAVAGQSALAEGRTLAKGEVLVFDVPFTPGAGESLLAVGVTGNFAGAHRTAVRAFPVGKRSALQKSKDKEGTAQVGGENVHLVPAETTAR